MKAAVQAVHGQNRIIPLYTEVISDAGNNLEYKVTQWGVVKVIDSNWGGAKNTFVKVQKAYMYDGSLRPHPGLNGYENVISGAFTSPALIE
jgi:hypothetical protein